mgnify:FL=1
MAPTVHHIALKSNHPGRLAPFYRDVVGAPEVARHVDDRGLRSVWLDLGGTLLMVERSERGGAPTPPAEDPPGLHLFALRIEAADRALWRRRLLAAGAPLMGESAYSMYFADPEGHRFALSHHPDPAPRSEPA